MSQCFIWSEHLHFPVASPSQGALCGCRLFLSETCPPQIERRFPDPRAGNLPSTLPPDSVPTIPAPPRLGAMADEDSFANLIRVIDEIRRGRPPVTDFEVQVFHAIEANLLRDLREQDAKAVTRYDRILRGLLPTSE